MRTERLVAAHLWLDELEAMLARAAAAKWKILGDEFDGEEPDENYEARSNEVDETKPIHDALAVARVVLEERALAVVDDHDALPAGGSAVARAYALAQAMHGEADPARVQAELRGLRTRLHVEQ
jgi:hypothetical protein